MEVPKEYVIQALNGKIDEVKKDLILEISNLRQDFKSEIGTLRESIKEFQGACAGDMRDHESRLRRLEVNSRKDHEDRIRGLEEFKYKVIAISASVAALSGLVYFILSIIFK